MDAGNFENVAVRDEFDWDVVVFPEPVVVIADDHEFIADVNVFFLPKDSRADLLIELNGALI